MFLVVCSQQTGYRNEEDNKQQSQKQANRARRDATVMPADAERLLNVTRYVELVIVNDYKVVSVCFTVCVCCEISPHVCLIDYFLCFVFWVPQYTKYGKNTEAIFERSKQIVNIVNSVCVCMF